MYKHNFVIFGSSWDLYKFSFSDVYEMENVQYIPLPFSGIKKYIYALYKRLMRLFPTSSVLAIIWLKFFSNKNFAEQKPICFIYLWGVLTDNYTSQTIRYLKKKYPNCKHVLFNTDLIATRNSKYTGYDAKRDYDLVLSFDPGDCTKYGLIYHPLVFSHYNSNNYPLKYDVFFLGQAKNRLKEIYDLYDLLTNCNLKVKFLLKGVEDKDKRIGDGLEYFTKNISYSDNLKYIEESKCVLEIMQKGGTGYTQRGCEVVGLNKKLLTNNPYIKNAPFYNEKYISTFDAVDNIDVNFLKRLVGDEVVEYGKEYRKKMSPKELLEFVEEMLEFFWIIVRMLYICGAFVIGQYEN